ncbi:MAG: hypothetical protein JNM56_05230 [Planctomycetia bacterium]|nr:hypothetical protein [Planctomycetia bacterium]
MTTRPVLALLGMLAASLALTGCKNCCSWGCKDANCDVAAQRRKLPPICDGTNCSHGGHAPTAVYKPATPPPGAQAGNWYNPPTQTRIETPATHSAQLPQAPAPIAVSPPPQPAPVHDVPTSASPIASQTPATTTVTPASNTQPAPMRSWPAENEAAIESRPMMPERTGADLDTPSAAPAPIATTPGNTTPMPARTPMLPPATEATLPPVETSAPVPVMPTQPTQVETQYHEVPSSTRTPVELPPAAPELPPVMQATPPAPELPVSAPAVEMNAAPAPASDNPLMLPPADDR